MISNKIEIISISEGVTSKNSSDLHMGRRPMSKNEEFFEVTPLVVEIWLPKIQLFTKTCGTLWEPDPPLGVGEHSMVFTSSSGPMAHTHA